MVFNGEWFYITKQNSLFYNSPSDTISDTLSYLLSLFLNTSFIILYFLILQIACSIPILLLECLWLYIFCCTVSSQSFSFLTGNNDLCSGYSFSIPKSLVKQAYYIFWQFRMIIFVDLVIMFLPYLSVYALFCRLSTPFDLLCTGSLL